MINFYYFDIVYLIIGGNKNDTGTSFELYFKYER